MLEAEKMDAAQQSLGYSFQNPTLLEVALTHASTIDAGGNHNERLEFLGDAVLSVVVCTMLFDRFPHMREGEMTKIKSNVVSRESCAVLAKKVGLERHLILGKGMKGTRSLPGSLVGSALESIVGAIYLDGGFGAAVAFITPLLTPLIEKAASSGHQQNFKSVLQQHAQQELDATPIYRVLDEQGPDHAKCFKVGVEIGGRKFEPAWGATKKRAEQDAALVALRELGLLVEEAGEIRIAEKEAT